MERSLLLLENFIYLNSPLIIFFSVIFLGEEGVFVMSILAGKGLIPITYLIIFGFLGLITADCIWFFIGRFECIKSTGCKMFKSKSYCKLYNLDLKIKSKSEFLSLFLSKFIYGIRLIKLLSMGCSKIKFRDFIIINIMSVLLWMTIMVPLGLLAGYGISFIFTTVNFFEKILMIIFFIILIVIVLEILIEKLILKSIKRYFKSN